MSATTYSPAVRRRRNEAMRARAIKVLNSHSHSNTAKCLARHVLELLDENAEHELEAATPAGETGS
jgi:hypothetical protein